MITDEAMLQSIQARMWGLNATHEERDGRIYCQGQDIGTISEVYHIGYYELIRIVQQCKETAQ
jgi:hypothetical protein